MAKKERKTHKNKHPETEEDDNNETEKNEDKEHPVRAATITFLIIYIITLAGFIITLPQEKTTVFTTPKEEITIQRTTTPLSEIEKLECKVAKYEILEEEIVNETGRKITIFNKQDEPWAFTVTANFTLTERTTTKVPTTSKETLEKRITINKGETESATFFPQNANSYNSIFVTILVTPEKREGCDVDIDNKLQERVETTTIIKEKTYNVPYTERVSLWEYLFSRI